MGQSLAVDVEDAAKFKCGTHSAVLDAATMTYVRGPSFMSGLGTKVPAGAPQPVFDVTMNADGSATLVAPPGAKGGGCEVC